MIALQVSDGALLAEATLSHGEIVGAHGQRESRVPALFVLMPCLILESPVDRYIQYLRH